MSIINGDIDLEGIKSLNRVIDENKVFIILVSNDRIPLTPPNSIKFLFKNASFQLQFQEEEFFSSRKISSDG
jgi:hypothetical protein